MGFGKKLKSAVGKVVTAIPGGDKLVSSGAFGVPGLFLESAADVANREKQAEKAIKDKAGQARELEAQLAQAQQQTILSQEDLKRIEEEKKRQTTFAGSSLQNIIERRKLGV